MEKEKCQKCEPKFYCVSQKVRLQTAGFTTSSDYVPLKLGGFKMLRKPQLFRPFLFSFKTPAYAWCKSHDLYSTFYSTCTCAGVTPHTSKLFIIEEEKKVGVNAQNGHVRKHFRSSQKHLPFFCPFPFPCLHAS